jgi:hypothetical protein
MPGLTEYVLRGGPCDGNTGTLSPAIDQSGQLTCGGHIYKISSPVEVSGGREVFRDAGAVPAPAPGGIAPHATTGWNALRRVFNHNLPKTVHHVARINRATHAELYHHSKVRR